MLYTPHPACFHGPITCMENSKTQSENNMKQYELKRTDQKFIGRARLEPGSLASYITGDDSLTRWFMEKKCALTLYIFKYFFTCKTPYYKTCKTLTQGA